MNNRSRTQRSQRNFGSTYDAQAKEVKLNLWIVVILILLLIPILQCIRSRLMLFSAEKLTIKKKDRRNENSLKTRKKRKVKKKKDRREMTPPCDNGRAERPRIQETKAL